MRDCYPPPFVIIKDTIATVKVGDKVFELHQGTNLFRTWAMGAPGLLIIEVNVQGVATYRNPTAAEMIEALVEEETG